MVLISTAPGANALGQESEQANCYEVAGMHDVEGRKLVIGSEVLILELNPVLLDPLDADERETVMDMLAEPFEVCEFSGRYVYVEAAKEFSQGWEFHKFAVLPEHLRRVS